MNAITLEQTHTSGVYGKRDSVIVRGSGAQIWDSAGRAYIDCTAGIGVANIGHSHPGPGRSDHKPGPNPDHLPGDVL